MSDPALRLFAVAVAALTLKQLLLAWYGALLRGKHHAYLNPEDARTFGGSVVEVEPAAILRYQRCLRNDVENLPLFFAVGGLAVAVGVEPTILGWTSGVFVGGRIAFTLAYLLGIQPVRTTSYVIATLALLALLAAVLNAVR